MAEHVPDVVTWLIQISEVLDTDGVLRLVVRRVLERLLEEEREGNRRAKKREEEAAYLEKYAAELRNALSFSQRRTSAIIAWELHRVGTPPCTHRLAEISIA